MNKHLVILALIPLMLSACKDTGHGDKVGSIVKVSEQGIFCRTFEAEIIRGGFSNGSGVGGQSFHFTVEDNPALVEKVKHFMETQEEVKITYRTELATFCRSDSDNNAFLTGIEALGKPAERPLQVDNTEPTKVEIVQPTSRDDKIMQLLKTQQALIEELANKGNQ
jgi:hypothetical protein